MGSEVDDEQYRYTRHPSKQEDGLQPQQFWVKHAHAFPLLTRVAKVALAAVATSVRTEQTWSHAGIINAPQRMRMSLDTLSDLLFLQQNADLEHLHKAVTMDRCRAAFAHWMQIKQARSQLRAEAASRVECRKRLLYAASA